MVTTTGLNSAIVIQICGAATDLAQTSLHQVSSHPAQTAVAPAGAFDLYGERHPAVTTAGYPPRLLRSQSQEQLFEFETSGCKVDRDVRLRDDGPLVVLK